MNSRGAWVDPAPKLNPADQADHEFRMELMRAMLRTYKHAKGGRNEGPWMNAGASAADVHANRNDRLALAEHARELQRDDALGSGITKGFVTEVVGTGIQLQSRTGNEDLDKILEDAFNERKNILDRATSTDWAGLQGLAFSGKMDDGDFFIVPFVPEDGGPLEVALVEAERVDTPSDIARDELAALGNPGGRIVDGVEKDAKGRIVAYWISKTHPGPVLAFGNVGPVGVLPTFKRTKDNFDRVLQSQMVRCWRPERAGQTRGISDYHAILQDLRDLDLLMLAAMKRMQVAACFAAFIKSGLSMDDLLSGLNGDEVLKLVTENNNDGNLEGTINPGMFMRLGIGEEVQHISPNFPSPELFPFVQAIAMRIGKALGITWEEVLNNFSEDNYSSARVGLTQSRRTYRTLQQWLAKMVLIPLRVAVLEDAILRNPAKFDGVTTEMLSMVRIQAPGWQWVDPAKEVKAGVMELENGMTTFSEFYATKGLDWQEQFVQIAAEEKFAQGLKSPALDALYEKVYGGKQQQQPQNAPNPPPQPDDEDDDDEDDEDSEDSPARRGMLERMIKEAA